MTDRLSTLLREAADAEMAGVHLELPGVDPAAAPATTVAGRRRHTWLVAAAAVALVGAGSLWWATRPPSTALRVGDGAATTTSPPSTVAATGPAGELAAALDATIAGAWNATLVIDGESDVLSYQPPDRYRLAETATGDAMVWIGDRSWTGSVAANDSVDWVETSGAPNPFGRVLRELSRPHAVTRTAGGDLSVDVDPAACDGASGASVADRSPCSLLVRLDGAWIARIEIPAAVAGSAPVVLELYSSSAGVEIPEPQPSGIASSSVPPTTAVPCTLRVTVAADAPAGTEQRVGDVLKARSEMGGTASTVTAMGRAAMAVDGVVSAVPGTDTGCSGALGIDIRRADR